MHIGDEFYTGLNGLEFFDSRGHVIINSDIGHIQLIYPPPLLAMEMSGSGERPYPDLSSSIASDMRDDPRKVDNLIDGHNYTRDDLHVWLTPLAMIPSPRDIPPQQHHLQQGKVDRRPIAAIEVVFKHDVCLSMIRVFNYNKSRTHSHRGVKLCVIYLDRLVLFDG